MDSGFLVSSQCRPLPPSPVCPGFMPFPSFLLPSFFLSCCEGYSGDTVSSLLTFLGLVLSDISMFRVRGLLVGDCCLSGFKGNRCEPGVSHLFAVPLPPRAFPSPPRLPSHWRQRHRVWRDPVDAAVSANVCWHKGGICSPSLSSP